MKATTWNWMRARFPGSPTPRRSANSSWSLPVAHLLEQPRLERLDFCEVFRTGRIHDEVRILGAHAVGKEPNQSAGCQVGLNERCARQGDTEARDGRGKQQCLLAVARPLSGGAVV